MLRISGQGKAGTDLPVDLAAARTYFEDVTAFFAKIEAIATVKPLARAHTYLITHHPVGGLDYRVVVITCMQVDWHEGGMRLVPLDFDPPERHQDLPVVKGFTEGDLRLTPEGGGTRVAFDFSVTVELPIVKVLKLLPRALVQATADGIMGLQVNNTVQTLFRKVQQDFTTLERTIPGAAPAAIPKN